MSVLYIWITDVTTVYYLRNMSCFFVIDWMIWIGYISKGYVLSGRIQDDKMSRQISNMHI